MLLNVLVSLLPVVSFLLFLVLLDSYKLVNQKATITTILVGALSAIASVFINKFLLNATTVDLPTYSTYIAPMVEESAKGAFMIFLFYTNRIGFVVDSAIRGFSLGTGFALVENMYYLQGLENATLFTWIVRGFGTAIMHGGATALFAITSKIFIDTKQSRNLLLLIPGFLIAAIVHGAFNGSTEFFPLIYVVASTVIVLPLLLFLAYNYSEKVTKTWLGVGFDKDAEVLTMITAGQLQQSRIGNYLESIRNRFPGEVVADLICYLRIYYELAVEAKGIMMMRESGFEPEPNPTLKEKFVELEYLKKSIGTTGYLSISPFLHIGNRELWQLYSLKSGI